MDSDDGGESTRRPSTDATPRPTPATSRFLTNPVPPDVLTPTQDSFSSSKRLGFFTDKLSHKGLNPGGLLNPHSHGHQPSTLSASISSASLTTISKSHTSPSKVSHGRTYDSKLVSREMHRLGNLAHSPSALAPPITSAPSATSLSLPNSGVPANLSLSSSSEPWGQLHVHVLPLFNGEPLRVPIEDLNVLVKRHIQSVVPSSPSKALATLENDTSELIASGMVTLNAKLMGIDDEKLVARVVEIWGFFWDQVLTYVEGVLLPLQTDPLLSSLYRTPKPHRTTSPSRQGSKGQLSSATSLSISLIDVRSIALHSFRDKVILPLSPRLHARLSVPNRQDNYQETTAYQRPRLQQMLLVLTSQRRQRPVAFSLTTPSPAPTAGEAAVTDLLRIVSIPPQISKNTAPISPLPRAPSFLSGALPRDRRGRIAHRPRKKNSQSISLMGSAENDADSEDKAGDETPRNVHSHYMAETEQEREFLEGLRSPDPPARASLGGWGLGAGHEEIGKAVEEEEEDEPMDWDQAQAVVERMVGMTSATEMRRKT